MPSEATYGLDLSQHNGEQDFNLIKRRSNDFVILRAGYGWSVDQKDPMFDQYYNQAKAAGLKVGAYWYSYARNVIEAQKEAACFLEVVRGKKFEMPLYIDMEDADGWKAANGNPSGAMQAKVANVFMQAVQDAGYYAGIYASTSWFNGFLAGLSDKFTRWEANWGFNDGSDHGGTSAPVHQYTSVYAIGNNKYDRNVCYVDFESAIRRFGLNGFPKENGADPKKSDEEIAEEVINGEWGNGDDRKNRLAAAGYNYDAIQGIVDARLTGKSYNEIAKEVINGAWGNGEDRRRRLSDAGYDYDAIQSIVNSMSSTKSINEIAKEVLNGAWGNGQDRVNRLTSAGYDYNAVQNEVNRLSGVSGLAVGDVVAPINLISSTGQGLVQYDPSYVITAIDGDNATLSANRNGSLQVWAVLKLNNLKRV